jgi:putative DNA primase/helicase
VKERDKDQLEVVDPAEALATLQHLDIEAMRGIASTVRALSNAARDTRQITTERADQIAPRKLRWLWPERIPLGKITVFAGMPGQGKSLATLDIAARVTTGSKYPDAANPLPPSEVLLVAGEDDPEDALVPRLMAANADRSRVHILKAVRVSGQDHSLCLDVDVKAIHEFLDDHPEIRLISFDPISNHLCDVSMVDEQEVRATLGPLKGIAQELDVAIIGVMHLNKKEGLSAIHRVGGAGAFIGVARASWLFAPDPESQSNRLMLPLKNNYMRKSSGFTYRLAERLVGIEGEDVGVPFIEWQGESDLDADEVLSAQNKGEAFSKAKAFIKDFLAEGPRDASDVSDTADAAGISQRTLDRAKAELGVESRKKSTGRWEWSLPDGQPKDASKG